MDVFTELYEQLDDAREEICDNYCKYIDMANKEEISGEELEKICKDCPLNKL